MPTLSQPTLELPLTHKTALKRHPERGTHARASIYAILDEALFCHVSVIVDGTPRVMPTAHARVGDHIYLHGARANRLLGELATGTPACVCVTLLDGLVFARTWFHHSMNFRSVVLFGTASEVTDPAEKQAALTALVDKAAPGRTGEARPPTLQELGSSFVVRVPVEEASAKMRSGPPLDGPELFSEDCWAGELPLRLSALSPVDDVNLRADIPPSVAVGERARTLSAGCAAPYERTQGDLVVSTDPARIDFSLVHRFLSEESYWALGVEAWGQRLAMAHSISFGLYRSDVQIGFARVVSDYARFAYLADVFVLPSARGAGLGKWLVASVLEHPDLANVDRWLLGAADAHNLYERFGFVRAEEGRYMVRRSVNSCRRGPPAA